MPGRLKAGATLVAAETESFRRPLAGSRVAAELALRWNSQLPGNPVRGAAIRPGDVWS